MTEATILAALAATDTIATEHPSWTAFAVWARRKRAIFDASRRHWRGQSPALDVAALEDTYDLSPAVLTIQARLGVSEGGAPWLP